MSGSPTSILEEEPVVLSPEERLGGDRALRRRELEGRPQFFGDGRKWIPLTVLDPVMSLIRRGLEYCGLYDPMARRATHFEIVQHDVWLRGLPEAFEGLRVLHLSDLHIDSFAGFGRRLIEAITPLAYDLVVITGDLRLEIKGPIEAVLDEMRPLVAVLSACPFGAYAILGNHDCLDLVEPLERLGLRYLLNESVGLERDGERIQVAGVDDAHFFGADDIDRALEASPVDESCIFLCHSPDLIYEAAARFCDLYLCGHTHGGQLCLPGGKPLISNASVSRRFCRGSWLLGGMRGYTSRGVGFSGLPLRSHCRAEIVVHRLLRERRCRSRIAHEEQEEAARHASD
ncbi:MAG: metallophosphoesterase [Planctomycetes bacterium]|nr:metallophosphoesterase [Planctomycetota bacterium]